MYRFHSIATNIHQVCARHGARYILGDERDIVLGLISLECSQGNTPKK